MTLASGRQTPRLAPATQADAADAAALTRAAITELCHADHGGDPDKIAAWCANKTPERFAAWIAEPDLLARVATGAKGLIGVFLATRKGEILLNYVAPEARGRGVTTALLAAAERELADLGVGRARLVSTVTAREFYLRRGWRPDGPEIVEFGMLGIPMVKDLQSP